jgi:hypothetical protein
MITRPLAALLIAAAHLAQALLGVTRWALARLTQLHLPAGRTRLATISSVAVVGLALPAGFAGATLAFTPPAGPDPPIAAMSTFGPPGMGDAGKAAATAHALHRAAHLHHLALVRAERRQAHRRAVRRAERQAALLAAQHTAATQAPVTPQGPPSSSDTGPPAVSAPQPAGSAQSYALTLAGAAQYPCVNAIFTRESGWNAAATNPTSGAFGIPQALPGSKMAAAGADWQSNPLTQVRWGIGYMNTVYGSPCAAWAHWQAAGSY